MFFIASYESVAFSGETVPFPPTWRSRTVDADALPYVESKDEKRKVMAREPYNMVCGAYLCRAPASLYFHLAARHEGEVARLVQFTNPKNK